MIGDDDDGIREMPVSGYKTRGVLPRGKHPGLRITVSILVMRAVKIQVGEVGQFPGSQDVQRLGSFLPSAKTLKFRGNRPITIAIN
jgi:hypothetical protein